MTCSPKTLPIPPKKCLKHPELYEQPHENPIIPWTQPKAACLARSSTKRNCSFCFLKYINILSYSIPHLPW